MTETPAASPEPTLADVMTVLQALASNMTVGFADIRAEMRQGFADTRDELRGEIQASEANLVSRVNAVQEVIRSVKADVARHVGDGNAHHRHAA